MTSPSRDVGARPVGPFDSPAQAGGFSPSESAGLFIGVGQFEDARLAPIPFACDDAADLAHLFSLGLGLIPPERVAIALFGEPSKPESLKRLEELRANGAAVEGASLSGAYRLLERLGGLSSPGGLFALAVATHGFSEGGRDYLVFADSVRKRVAQTGMPADALFEEVADARASRRLVFLDACRERLLAETRSAAPEPASAMSPSLARAIAQARGQAILCGASAGGYAYDDHERRNGVFTAAILDGLTGKAEPDARGFVTVGSLAFYANAVVGEWVARHRPKGANRHRGIESRLEGEAAAIPLAVHAGHRESQTRETGRRERALRLLEEARREDRELLGAEILGWVERRLAQGSVQEIEELLEQLEELEDNRSVRRRAFAAWWRLQMSESPLGFFANPMAPEPSLQAPPAEPLPKSLPKRSRSEPAPLAQSAPWAAASSPLAPAAPAATLEQPQPAPASKQRSLAIPLTLLGLGLAAAAAWLALSARGASALDASAPSSSLAAVIPAPLKTPVPDPPPNDNFSAAIPLQGVQGTIEFSNAGATREAHEPDHAGAPGGHSLWWRCTAPSSGELSLAASSKTLHPLLAVYEYAPPKPIRVLVASASSADQRLAVVKLDTLADVTYYIAIDSPIDLLGIVSLSWKFVITQSKEQSGLQTRTKAQTLVVSSSGAGQYLSIQDAITNSIDGDTINIMPGNYKERLIFKNGIKMIGIDKELCQIVWEENDHILVIENCQAGLIQNLSFNNSNKATGVKMIKSNVNINNCRFINSADNGLSLISESSGVLELNSFEYNKTNGIYIDKSNPQLIANICKNNGTNGMSFGINSKGEVKENICENNSLNGINMFGLGTTPNLRGNFCRLNSEGIWFGAGSGGLAENNTCDNNRKSGIVLHGNGTNPIIRNNFCSENKDFGIWIGVGADGTIDGNTCNNNENSGIQVFGLGSDPTVKNNNCYSNSNGIWVAAGARGNIDDNTCENNRFSGIGLHGAGTAPRLISNICKSNESYGILFCAGALGRAEGNICEQNKLSGITIQHKETNPNIGENISRLNKKWNVFYTDGAIGNSE
jgi:parallel beta-helix repeat protein